MPSPSNCLPIIGDDHEILDYASPERAQRLIAAGLVDAVGTRTRVRGLRARRGRESELRAARIPTGTRYVHQAETEDNPQGVWTFSKRSLQN